MQVSLMVEKEKQEEKTESTTQEPISETKEVKSSNEKIEGYWESMQEFLVNLP